MRLVDRWIKQSINMKRTRKEPPPLPANSIKAVVLRENQHWFAVFDNQRLPISDTCAWNFDIESGLPIVILLDEAGQCRIIHKKNNKKYVRI